MKKIILLILIIAPFSLYANENAKEKKIAKYVMENIQKEIARFKHPKQLILIERLPRNTMGKVQKNVLRQQYNNAY